MSILSLTFKLQIQGIHSYLNKKQFTLNFPNVSLHFPYNLPLLWSCAYFLPIWNRYWNKNEKKWQKIVGYFHFIDAEITNEHLLTHICNNQNFLHFLRGRLLWKLFVAKEAKFWSFCIEYQWNKQQLTSDFFSYSHK